MSRRTIKTGLWGSLRDGLRQGRQENKQHVTDEPDRIRNELITEDYHYGALKDGALSIRLLQLLPGTRQDDIALTLYETDLDKCAGSYEALSYVWKDVSEKTPVLINEKTLGIGTNLRCALLNLRLEDKPRTLWIDAICIDQTNIKERGRQVTIMGQIYRRASQTIVWLCDQTKETGEAFTMMEDLAEEAISLAQTDGSSTTSGSARHVDMARLFNKPISMMEKADTDTPMFHRYNTDGSILHIVGSDWWYRAWTTQEILLSSRATIVAGRKAMDWDRFCVGGSHGLNLGLWLPLTMGIILDPIVMPYLSLQSLISRRRTHDPNATQAQNLLDLLIRCRFREASNPRDKVYALLGLVADPSLPCDTPLDIRPDYTSPVCDVYVHTTRQILLGSDTLDVLGAGPPTASESGLPSWVPDWSMTDLIALPLINDALGRPRSTHATLHGTALPRFLDDGVTLALQAREVTTLVALVQPLARIEFRSRDVLKDLLESQSDHSKVEDTLTARLAVLGEAWKILATLYEALMSVVPHLGTYADWEAFAREVPPTNPVPYNGARTKYEEASKPGRETSAPIGIGSLIRATSDLSMATGLVAGDRGEEEEPDDPLAVYWQTLCTGTYATDADMNSGTNMHAAAVRKGGKMATQQLFYSWRASLKPISDLHKWRADRMLRPLGFVGYVRKTWRGYGEFMRFIEGAYERRLGRGANGYLCLVPEMAEVGDKVLLVKGGRVPLVVRRDGGRCWRIVGEAYVHGIMDGQVWDESACTEFKIK